MNKVKGERTTKGYNPLHHDLSIKQRNAIDLLMSGKNDRETAEAIRVNRVTVTRWRLNDPVFQAALNVRRKEIFGAGADRLLALVPRALDILQEEMNRPDNPHRARLALRVLELAGIRNATPDGKTSPEEIVEDMVKSRLAERKKNRPWRDGVFADQARADVLNELEEKLSGNGAA
jgi:hypothetical protein